MLKMNKYNKYIRWEMCGSQTHFELTHNETLDLREKLCKFDHSSTKNENMRWEDDHCGLSYYTCNECG